MLRGVLGRVIIVYEEKKTKKSVRKFAEGGTNDVETYLVVRLGHLTLKLDLDSPDHSSKDRAKL